MRQFILLCLWAGLFLQCQNSTSSSPKDSEQSGVMTAICDCIQPSIKLNAKMEELMQAGNREEFIQMVEVVGQQMEKSLNCCQSKWREQGRELGKELLAEVIVNSCEGIPLKMAMRIAEYLDNREGEGN